MSDEDVEASDSDIKFCPPLYIQRYQFAQEQIEALKASKIIDFGCAECKFISRLKRDDVAEIIGVDIDKDLLDKHAYLAEPLLSDYLICRENPLTIKLFKGSVTEFDERLLDFDMVTCIELIEHLHKKELDNFPQSIFGNLQPKFVLISTPNCEFNVLFKSMPCGTFRHYDHKFEWTRKEFETWCYTITSTYPYDVTFTGLGNPPAGMEHVGFCSQIAIFTRKSLTDATPDIIKDDSEKMPYELVKEVVYPFKSLDEKRQDDIFVCVNEIIKEIIATVKKQQTSSNHFLDRYNALKYSLSPIKEALPLHTQLSRKLKKECPKKKFFVRQHNIALGQFENDINYDIHNSDEITDNYLRTFTETIVFPSESTKFWIKYLDEKYFSSFPLIKSVSGQFEDTDGCSVNSEEEILPVHLHENCEADNHLPYTYCKLYNQLKISTNYLLQHNSIRELKSSKQELINAVKRLDYRSMSPCENLVVADLELYENASTRTDGHNRSSGYESELDESELDETCFDQLDKSVELIDRDIFFEESWD